MRTPGLQVVLAFELFENATVRERLLVQRLIEAILRFNQRAGVWVAPEVELASTPEGCP